MASFAKNFLFSISLATFLAFLASACTRYGIHNTGSQQYPPAQIALPLPSSLVEEKLFAFLERRGLNPLLHRSQTGDRVDLECSWVRDSSLDLFYIVSGTRKPHLVHWKAVWRLENQNLAQTLVTVKIMELLFLGPQEDAGPAPLLNGQWLESPETHLRDGLELRRFYTETYPQRELPEALASLKVPQLNFPPLSLQGWRPMQLYRRSTPLSF